MSIACVVGRIGLALDSPETDVPDGDDGPAVCEGAKRLFRRRIAELVGKLGRIDEIIGVSYFPGRRSLVEAVTFKKGTFRILPARNR